ncbi:HtaA domain-containing protein [Conexibacter sp. JD483]|uniref:HtaA domain-containing protein n=1 Tax=unclassified Conexibacter TaxID=2627773 RepID=UPI0027226B95|nr:MULTISPECIES: HtaA domain-containing protein [unclassified Conexibacter]MDO8188691.1 HtaA domain-containing protein [Conexibacter sp. CPCC 205706]MDO8201557.1 HtaA domain-containing protein [Conexibacter sp. CPCC 205762]MDR9371648.1 HtaA domain-containing protein [Conexibacter sp. JD483]
MRQLTLALAATASAVAAGAGLPPLASAAAGWQPATSVATTTSASGAEVAIDRAGVATAVWADASGLIRAATRPRGGDWSAPQAISGARTGYAPSLALDPDGQATVVWRSVATVDGADTTEAWTATRSDGRWSTATALSAAGATITADPSVLVDATGTATAAWAENCVVQVATRPARGSWSAPRELWRDTTGTCALYRIATPVALGADRSGRVTAAWQAGHRLSVDDARPRRILAAARGISPTSDWSAPTTLASVTTSALGGPSLAVDVDGRALAAWSENGAGARAATRPAGSDPAVAWNATATLSSAGTPLLDSAYDGHGRGVVAFATPDLGDGRSLVQVARASAADGALQPAQTVATLPDGVYSAAAPALALDDEGAAVVAWTQSTASGFAAYASRAAAGAGTWDAPVALAGDLAVEDAPAVASDPLGDVVALAGGEGPLRSLTYLAEPPLAAEWSGRASAEDGSLRSWVDYLRRTWPSAIPGVPSGAGAVELSDGASFPEAADPYSFRFGQADAWRDTTSGETVVTQQGTVRFSLPPHAIDIRLVNPQLRIAPDGASARLVSDGFTSGSMEDALAGRTSLTPYVGLHVLDVDLAAAGARAGDLVGRRSWIAAPVTMTDVGGRTLGLPNYIGQRWGTITVTLPQTVRDYTPPGPPERPPVDPPADPPRPPAESPRAPARSGASAPQVSGRARVSVDRSGSAAVATVVCRAGGASCRVAVPRQVRVTIAGRRFWAAVLAPRTIRAGRRGAVRLRLTRAAARRLAGRSARARLKLVVTSGRARTAKTLTITLRGAAVRRARR